MRFPSFIPLLGLLVMTAPVWAGESAVPGLFEAWTGRGFGDHPVLRSLGMTAGGWISLGLSYNARDPADHSSAPVAFNDRSSDLQLNQLYVYLERPVNKDAHRWSLGGRVDFLWGTDSRFSQAVGHWDDDLIQAQSLRFYDLAIPQAYIELATPWRRMGTVRLGHFYTLLGQEVVQAPGNFFFSHSYAMVQEPFTHTGALLNQPVSESLSLQVGAVTGPRGRADNVDQHGEDWNFLGGSTWASGDGRTSVSAALTSGADSAYGGNRTIGSVIFNRELDVGLRYIAQFDHGSQAFASGAPAAEWYGSVHYLLRDLNRTVSVGLRGEWFRDDDGFRILSRPATFYGLTAGVNWKPEGWLQLRFEGRNDWSDGPVPAFDAGRQSHQLTFGANATVLF